MKTKLLATILLLALPNVALADDLIFSDSFDGPCGTDCPPVVEDCTNSLDPWNKPAGYTERIVSWNNAFSGTSFYTPTNNLHAIGSRNIWDQPVSFNYLSIPFTPQPNSVYDIKWEEAQVINGYYYPRPAHTVFVTVSPCAGDFRREDNQADDPFLKRGCRRAGQATAINFRTDFPNSTTSYCALQPGNLYYLNILFADPNEEVPSVSCVTGIKCEANFRPR